MKESVHTWTCDHCRQSVSWTDPSEVSEWRSLVVEFSGAPYPEFQGDLCGACVQKIRSYFAHLRPGAEAKALLDSAGSVVKASD